MTFMPILERELRVRARSRATYWSRFAVGLAGALIWLSLLTWRWPLGAPGGMGRSLLNGVVSAGVVVSCASCLLTADVISSERREGTLELLLITRVRAFDVVVGKLGSAGLTSLSALVAFMPMLMIPVLAGGVTGGEAFRKGLVLPDTLFLALGAGLWASAGGREWLKTARAALLLLAAVVLVPVLLDFAFAPFFPAGRTVGLLSPLKTLLSAGDASYKAWPGQFWISLVLVHATAWAVVVSAGFRLQEAPREEGGEASVAVPEPARRAGTEPGGPWLSCSWTPPLPGISGEGQKEAGSPRPRRPLVGATNPMVWLLQRQRGTRMMLWAGALVGPIQYAVFPFLFRFVGVSGYMTLVWSSGLVLSALASALFAWAASRYFVEARRTGELELLLTTPSGPKELLAAQWGVLKRLFRWPMLVMIAPAILQVGVVLVRAGGAAFGPPDPYGLIYAMSSVLNCLNLLLGTGALFWVGMWFGLKAGRQAQAVVWTVSLVKGFPVLAASVCSTMLNAVASGSGRWGPAPYWWITLWLPQLASLLFYSGLICLARGHLVSDLAAGEPLRFDLRQSLTAAVQVALATARKARHWTPA